MSAPRVYADRPEEREVYRSGDPALSDRDRLVAFAAELDELDRTWASTPLAAERAALVLRAIDTMDRAEKAEAERDAFRDALVSLFGETQCLASEFEVLTADVDALRAEIAARKDARAELLALKRALKGGAA